MAKVLSVNVGSEKSSEHAKTRVTGIDERPVSEALVRAPGPKRGGLGSGLVGDFIGDHKHHGGDIQAVYAVAREELDYWERKLGRELPSGCFGENLTTQNLIVDDALIGEVWQVGEGEDVVVLRVTAPRVPCNTFKGWIQERGWLQTFAAHARTGTYLSVVKEGTVRPGDPVAVIERPEHSVTVELLFRALTTEPELAAQALSAAAYLEEEAIAKLQRREVYRLG